MQIVITDSGLGGLAVCADLERALGKLNPPAALDIVYLNAAPTDEYGYNRMPDRQTKVAVFDRFLYNAHERFQPVLTYIACNTLHVLYPATSFSTAASIPVGGIVGDGQELLGESLKQRPESPVILFATETTIHENTYGRGLREAGVGDGNLINQPCPRLAHTISNDHGGAAVRELVRQFTAEAMERISRNPTEIHAFLGCTHFGFQTRIFQEELQRHAAQVTILNPNLQAARSILGMLPQQPAEGNTQVRFISAYPVPEVEIESLMIYLADMDAPLTRQALQEQQIMPDLVPDPREWV